MAGRSARMAASNAQRGRQRGFVHRLAAVRAFLQLVKITVIAVGVLVLAIVILSHHPAPAPAQGGQPTTQATP
jgi:hypothetical protein